MSDLDSIERRIVNEWQEGVPVCSRPYAVMAEKLGIGEAELLARIESLLARKVLTRFGPLFNADRMGGGFLLAAIAVPEARFDEVADKVNAFPEVAHNYARTHALNMWFVIACEKPERIGEVVAEIEAATGLTVHPMPKLAEFFIDARFAA
ncbi:MAG: Lrp/AsnC family transcriptional regulator [Rhodospirillales bacterium]|jgi:DNA-binding Lrp family transcriptional regulator|nr:Lrp/AsnC family transcriptional regulator [Rhodospirillales bacterium]MDK9723050.1 Lrp/AsnC family transcriptional regulator [Rhodospirillales bacterium]